MSSKAPSRVVFVGNIPYGTCLSSSCQLLLLLTLGLGLSEEQISELFSSAGQVLNFRLVYDRDTGRPKGFGFAEYPDSGMDAWTPFVQSFLSDSDSASFQTLRPLPCAT